MIKYISNSGIYIISNTKNGHCYIGQTTNLRKRFTEHKAMLRGNYHPNQPLQRAWNKHGEKYFKFSILERCKVSDLDEREQHFLNIYMPKGICYNISRNVEATTRGLKLSEEHKHKLSDYQGNRTEEHKRKLIEARHNRPPITEETRSKMSMARKGKKHSPETRAKISEQRHKYTYVFTSPAGIETQTKDITAFCEENGLGSRNIRRVANGERSHHKGWKCRRL